MSTATRLFSAAHCSAKKPWSSGRCSASGSACASSRSLSKSPYAAAFHTAGKVGEFNVRPGRLRIKTVLEASSIQGFRLVVCNGSTCHPTCCERGRALTSDAPLLIWNGRSANPSRHGTTRALRWLVQRPLSTLRMALRPGCDAPASNENKAQATSDRRALRTRVDSLVRCRHLGSDGLPDGAPDKLGKPTRSFTAVLALC